MRQRQGSLSSFQRGLGEKLDCYKSVFRHTAVFQLRTQRRSVFGLEEEDALARLQLRQAMDNAFTNDYQTSMR